MMGGQPLLTPQYDQQQHQQQQPHQSYYAQNQQQPQTSYYVQQQQRQQQQQPSFPNPSTTSTSRTTATSGSNQSYAARSAAALNSPNGIQPPQQGSGGGSLHASQHGAIDSNRLGSQHSNNNDEGNITSGKLKSTHGGGVGGENPRQTAEQTRILHAATQKVTEYSYQMQRAMENNDVCSTLENACLLLEELGDPNHGLHHKGGGSGNRGEEED